MSQLSPNSTSLPKCRSSLLARRGINLTPLLEVESKDQKVIPPWELPISGEYDLLETLGEGAFSIVKRAMRKMDAAVFAVKTSHCQESELRTTALKEYRILSRLCHPNIIRVEELQESESLEYVCLVLELCTGGSVHHHVHRVGPFQEQQCRVLMQNFTGCLYYLHTAGIVHRDLKPANLLLQTCAGESLVLKIADFGSAAEIGGDNAGSGEMLTDRGTKQYAAPEFLFGLIWDERIDIWACGLCCYYMLKGKIPFDILEPEVEKTLRKGSLPKMCWQGLSDPVVCFLQQCLTVKVEDRPPAKELELTSSEWVERVREVPRN